MFSIVNNVSFDIGIGGENMFNEKQLEFINTLEGRVALISVAGSGKTSSTIERIKNIVKHGV